jgi:hypothetical protein
MGIQINFNQVVGVKLTKIGLYRYTAIVEKRQDTPSIFDLSYTPASDENGYYHIQLWQLMRDYGDLLNNTGYPPFEMEAILFESPPGRN